MKWPPFLVLLCLCSWVFAYTPSSEFDEYLAYRGKALLRTQQNDFLKMVGLQKLAWDNADHRQIIYRRSFAQEPFTLCGVQIVEAVFSFNERKQLESVKLSMYNRGDCGQWPFKQFDDTRRTLQQGLTELTKVRQPEKSKRRLEHDDKKESLEQLLWKQQGYDVALVWCGDKEYTEYISVAIEAHNSIPKLTDSLKTNVQKSEIRNQVEKEVNGDRWISVPMVNQGEKGYCMSAVVERLMKYYNSSIDQHILAQIFNTQSDQGTSLEDAIQALDDNKSKLRINIKKKLSYPPLYTGKRLSAKRFLLMVSESIDRGIPLFWTVILPPDPPYHNGGGHARLINGYNTRNNTIIYTDSWGAGHERKTMPVQQAIDLSTSVYLITPR